MLSKYTFYQNFLQWLQIGIPGAADHALIKKEKVVKAFSVLLTALLIFYFFLFSSLHFFPKGPICIVAVVLPLFFSIILSIFSFKEKITASLFILTWILPTAMAFASWYDPVYNYSKVMIICMLVVFLAHESKMQQVIGFLIFAITYSWMQIRYDQSLSKDFSDHAIVLDFTMMLVFCLILFFVFSRIKKEFRSYQNECNSQRDGLERKKTALESVVFLNKAKSERLKQSVLLKEKLIAIVSHDVRTPINSFKFMIESYEHGHITQQMLIDALLETKQGIINLDKMVVDLVNWKRNDAAHDSKDNVKCSLIPGLLDSVKSIYNLSAKNKKLDVVSAADIGEHMSLLIERKELEIIVRNLLSNAIKFSQPQGKVILKLQQIKCAASPVAVLTVQDFGVGMSRQVLKTLNSNKVVSTAGTLDEIGLGIGLSMVFDIIHKHNFEYNIESEQGKGALFSIKIPLVTNPENPLVNTATANISQL